MRTGLAIARFFAGDTEAIEDMKRALANAEAVADDYTVAFIAQALGEGYTQLGDFEMQNSISIPPSITTAATTCGPTWRGFSNRSSIGTNSRVAARKRNMPVRRPSG